MRSPSVLVVLTHWPAARALLENTELDARDVVERGLALAADICVYTNTNLVVEELATKSS